MWLLFIAAAVAIGIWYYNRDNDSTAAYRKSQKTLERAERAKRERERVANEYKARIQELQRRSAEENADAVKNRPTVHSSTGSVKRPSASAASARPQTLTQCIDKQSDSIFQLNQSDANVIRQTQSVQTKSSAAIRNVEQISYVNIDLSWIANLKGNLEAANTLEKNLEIQENNRLNQSKFQYYTSLHFRSMIAADLVYAEYEKATSSLNQISRIIGSVKNHSIRVSSEQYSELVETRRAIQKARELLLHHVQELNHKTHSFKLKIRDECGQRGREWYEKMDKH